MWEFRKNKNIKNEEIKHLIGIIRYNNIRL